MSENGSGGGPNGTPNAIPTIIRYVYWGAITGLLAGLVTLFAISTYYRWTVTGSPVDCVVFGSVFTLMLSQPAGLVGLIAGTAAGALAGGVATYVHHIRRTN
jgi:hypothetical protein